MSYTDSLALDPSALVRRGHPNAESRAGDEITKPCTDKASALLVADASQQ